MNIVSLCTQDFGGLAYVLCNQINRLTPHRATHIISRPLYTKKPFMQRLRKGNVGRIRRLIRNADVLHINESTRIWGVYGLSKVNLKGRKIVLHGHGTPFRVKGNDIIRFYKTRLPQTKIILSTPDLTQHARGAWFPSIIAVDDLRQKYRTRRNNPPVVYYSPTKLPEYWDLETLNAATDKLRKERMRFHVNVISEVTHRLNMELKSKADIYFDELKIFYGINALEAAVFGLAVIHGMSPYCRAYMKKRKMGCPFNSVPSGDYGGFVKVLRRLVKDRKLRIRKGKAAQKYVERVHSPKACVKRFLSLVE